MVLAFRNTGISSFESLQFRFNCKINLARFFFTPGKYGHLPPMTQQRSFSWILNSKRWFRCRKVIGGILPGVRSSRQRPSGESYQGSSEDPCQRSLPGGSSRRGNPTRGSFRAATAAWVIGGISPGVKKNLATSLHHRSILIAVAEDGCWPATLISINLVNSENSNLIILQASNPDNQINVRKRCYRVRQ